MLSEDDNVINLKLTARDPKPSVREAPLLIFHKLYRRLLRQMPVEHLARKGAARPLLLEIGISGTASLTLL
jgi:hypothetical protein